MGIEILAIIEGRLVWPGVYCYPKLLAGLEVINGTAWLPNSRKKNIKLNAWTQNDIILHNKFSITADQAKCFKLTSIYISDSADSGEY